jgi:hypothetical protein
MSIDVQIQSASGRCEVVTVSERRNDTQTCNAALRELLSRLNDSANTGGWRVLSLGTHWR